MPAFAPSRRFLHPPGARSARLVASAALAATLCGGALAQPAPAAAAPSFPAAATADGDTWRALSRLGYGPTPSRVAEVRQTGGARAWALAQVDAAAAASAQPPRPAPELAAFDQPLPEIFARFRAEREARRERRDAGNPPAGTAPMPPAAASADPDPRLSYSKDSIQAAAAWRLSACSRPDLEQPLLARLTEFWFNHLNVSADKGSVRPFAGHYLLHAIRPHVLGRFEDMLRASARHPAMLYYLDQAQSVAESTPRGGQARGLNENYARELMELHTLGVQGGYTQSDVRELARVLTGWTVAPDQPGGFRFAPRLHDAGSKTVLGQPFGPTDPRDARAGEYEGLAALHLLATHPATARRVALRLAQWFVADAPPPALVEQLARSFLSSGGDSRALLRTLVQSGAFWERANTLFKTPFDYACSALAACGGPQDAREFTQTLNLLQGAGQGVLRWPTPDGYKTDRATWLAPEALTHRADYALGLARRNPPVDFLTEFMQPATLRHIDAQPAPLRAGLLLASREFMSK